MGSFDFDYWKDLAERDPAAYFEARRHLLQQFIQRDPERAAALAELQAHIDATRVLAGPPGQACRQLLGLVEDQLQLLGARLSELREGVETLQGMLPGRR